MMQSNTCVISVEDLQKPKGPILTGVGYLDHMIDQFNSHAQIGVSIIVGDAASKDHESRNRNATTDQGELMFFVGSQFGAEIKRLVMETSKLHPGTIGNSRFSCPLDEALVECELTVALEPGKLTKYTLAPFGIYPRTGRTHIGSMETAKLERFFAGLAEASHLNISLHKVRGHNAHHIVESAFKAASRALRNLLDGVTCDAHCSKLDALYGARSDNHKAGLDQVRQGTLSRTTKETSILVTLKVDGGVAGVKVSSGIKTLDTFFMELAKHAGTSLDLSCQGDLYIDEHHTAEDVSIALGQCLVEALGTKAGLNRMWCSTMASGAARVQVVMDLSNRPCLTHNLSLARDDEEMVGDLSLEMFEHALESLVANARMTVHIVELVPGSLEDTVVATAMAFGETLRYCSMVDMRRGGATASSKGTLSV
ncbi:hypothetical protein MPSEU_000024200 [Mayamaea pseudoterrestris]|nr:hypothetical protein MPSEU_000024200 [Mayamaea pseudoterrestris]